MKKTVCFVLFLLISACSGLRAQTSGPNTDHTSIVVLNGPWKFHVGDSPEATGSKGPQWASPDFDDSGWQDYTIDPKHPALTAMQALQPEALPGWQQHGHPGYTGYAWYRIRLQTPSDVHALALLMPGHVDDAYEVFVNGTKIGSLGKLDGFIVVYYYARPRVFSIPAAALHQGQPITLAVRFRNQSWEASQSLHNLRGGLLGVPILGPSALLHVFQRSLHDRAWRRAWIGGLLMSLYGAIGVLSLFLFFFSRSQREYLWAGISLIGEGVRFAVLSVAPQTNIPAQLVNVVSFVMGWIGLFALPLAAMYLLSIARPLWRRANYTVMAVIVASQFVYLGALLGLLPPTAAMDRVARTFVPELIAYALLLVAIAVDGLRTIGRKAWLPLAPGLLFVSALVAHIVLYSHSSSSPISDYLYLSVPLVVLVIFLLRFTEQQRENVRLVDDMRQAQEVQRVLIPAVSPNTPGFAVESVYIPASEVGGDFFHLSPADDGSLLVVVGDVSGKGLKAAMTVSAIVGALRNEKERPPAEVLSNLNRVLHGQVSGFLTCCAALISADGKLTIANAGHLSPYRNGEELAVAGGLPLGILAEGSYEETRYEFVPGDRLTFMSDGVVEARNTQGELYGFERTQKISNQPAPAIADAAKNFGQEDDITVVTVMRTLEATHAIYISAT